MALIRRLHAPQQTRHCRIQTAGDYLQGDYSNLTLAQFDVRDMAPIQIQVDRHIGLRPILLFSERLDTLS